MIEDSSPEPSSTLRRFGPLPGYNEPGILRYPWLKPALAVAPAQGWCCQCMDDNAAPWDEAVAAFVLLESEWKVWVHLPHEAARRRWMRGRVAAKDAIRLLLLDRYGVAAPLETISVLPDQHGQPQVSCTAVSKTDAGIAISISHCGNSSVALASDRSGGCLEVGIDVASQTDNHDGLEEGGFASTEMALLHDCPATERADWLLRLWCAKEAVSKALGVGLRGNPLHYLVRRIDRARGTADVEAHLETTILPQGLVRLTATVGCDRGMAFAVAHRGDSQ